MQSWASRAVLPIALPLRIIDSADARQTASVLILIAKALPQ
jgi:hypothetical protein